MNQVTSASLRYPLSVFNKKSTLKQKRQELETLEMLSPKCYLCHVFKKIAAEDGEIKTAMRVVFET